MRIYKEVFDAREQRADARTALLCSVIANCHRDPKARRQPYRVEDFMPRTRPQTRDELVQKIRAFGTALRPLPD